MPHVIVEHSSDIDVKPLLGQLHGVVSSFDTVDPERIKTRAAMFRFHTVSGSTVTSFIHVELKLLEGRSADLLSSFADAIQKEAKAFAESQGGGTAVSTSLVELLKNQYRSDLV